MRQYFSLNHQVTFYVPSTGENQKHVTASVLKSRTEEVAGQFSDWFGGATIQRVQGFYKTKAGSYVVETINKVISFANDEALEAHSEATINLAGQKRREWYQETIGLEIDNRFMLID